MMSPGRLLLLVAACPFFAPDSTVAGQAPTLVSQKQTVTAEMIHPLVDASDLIVIARIIEAPEGVCGSSPIISSPPQRYAMDCIARIRIEKMLKGTAEKFSAPLITLRIPMVAASTSEAFATLEEALAPYQPGTKMIFFLQDRRLRPELGDTSAKGEPVSLVGFDPYLSCLPYNEELAEAVRRKIHGLSTPHTYEAELVAGAAKYAGWEFRLNLRKNGDVHRECVLFIKEENPFFATLQKDFARLQNKEIFYKIRLKDEVPRGKTIYWGSHGGIVDPKAHIPIYPDTPTSPPVFVASSSEGIYKISASLIVSLHQISQNDYLGIKPRLVKPPSPPISE